MAKKSPKTKKDLGPIVNRRAKFDYQLEEKLTTGLVLNGAQVRAIRDGKISLKGSFVTIRNGELFLNNASLSLRQPDQTGLIVNTEPIKLLANKREISQLDQQKQAGWSIVPLRILRNQKHIKLEIAPGRGKKLYDKRQVIKKRDLSREDARIRV